MKLRRTHSRLKSGTAPDYFILALFFVLTVAGLVILASASSDLGKIQHNDSYYFLKHQILYGLSLGILGFLIGMNLPYKHYRTFAFFFLLGNLALLALVFTKFGIVAGGASRWLKFGPVTFQPAELLKLTFVLYLAAWFTNPKMNRVRDFYQGIIPFFIISGIVTTLLLLQPATSTVAILMMAACVMYFVSGAQWKHIGLFAIAVVALVSLLLFASYAHWISPYRWQRIQTFLHPANDIQGSGYQINQALNALGSGKLWGMGYGQSTSKVNSLPAPLDDSIFAVAGQELGFVGAGTLMLLFLLLVFRLLWLARRVRDRFGQLILVGFAVIIGFQSLVNMGAISGLFPLTGVPLPFVSYGGSALAVFLTMGGIAMNVSKHS